MRSLPISLAILAVASAAVPALAQVEVANDGRRVVQLTVYGTDPCPTSDEGEIVVCQRRPEEERYRLPRIFRGTDGKPTAVNQNGASRDQSAKEAAGSGINSCSAVGPGGGGGCTVRAAREWRQDREAPKPVEVVNEP